MYMIDVEQVLCDFHFEQQERRINNILKQHISNWALIRFSPVS